MKKATKRLNKKTKRLTRIDSKASKNVQVVKDYPDTLAGRSVVLKIIPGNIKRAKRLFEVGKKYKIQKTKDNRVNTGMGVLLKGKDEKIYHVQFPYYHLFPDN